MNIAVLDAMTLGDDISFNLIKEQGDVKIYPLTSEDALRERLKDAECVIINKVRLNEEILKDCSSLKLICVAATGYDNIDVSYCKKKGIAVCNVVGYSSHSVSQLTLAMVLALSVHLREYTDFVRSGEYTKSGVANKLEPVYYELYGKVWGIVGFGNIGREVAKAASALGCKILVNKRTPTADFECVDLDFLCRNSDIITIHTPLNDVTRGMISKEKIALMKREAIVVNTSRGAVVDELAIAQAIKENKIGAFGTDVYSSEPFGEDHPFNSIINVNNVCFTPHMGWGAFEARNRCMAEIAKNIEAFKNGEIRNRVDMI